MNLMRNELASTGPALGRHRSSLWSIRIATLIGLTASLASISLIWLTLSRPLDVARAMTGENAWRVARAVGLLVVDLVARLVAWL